MQGVHGLMSPRGRGFGRKRPSGERSRAPPVPKHPGTALKAPRRTCPCSCDASGPCAIGLVFMGFYRSLANAETKTPPVFDRGRSLPRKIGRPIFLGSRRSVRQVLALTAPRQRAVERAVARGPRCVALGDVGVEDHGRRSVAVMSQGRWARTLRSRNCRCNTVRRVANGIGNFFWRCVATRLPPRRLQRIGFRCLRARARRSLASGVRPSRETNPPSRSGDA